ncbi:hypothetical protein [Bacteroides sp. UBA939]|uniref:hypothetical protein n=1 Tax=Bacteroides sp. UBA939 TaxID=1946092 RepID=UPI0025BA4F85|nr:hypothetical protein [Bacteroides sp. UBA939]
MKRMIFFLFLFMILVRAGLCTARTTDDTYLLIEGCFFLFTHIADELFFFNLFKVQVAPTTVLVDKKGVIRYWDEGTNVGKREFLLDQLKELSAE